MKTEPDHEMDARLDTLLRRLPDKPVPSNFTTRVMRQIERETSPARPRASRWNFWHKLLPRAATAAVLLSVGLFSLHTYREHQRMELAHSLATVSKVDPLNDPDVLINFEAIKRMSQTRSADEELIALMQ